MTGVPSLTICWNTVIARNSALPTTRVPMSVIGEVRPALGTTVVYTGRPRSVSHMTASVESTSMVSGLTIGQ